MACGFRAVGSILDMGTHNRSSGLGQRNILNLLRLALDIPAPAQPRWFDLDRFAGAPGRVRGFQWLPDLDVALTQTFFGRQSLEFGAWGFALAHDDTLRMVSFP